MISLVIGGARSGKSAFAQTLAEGNNKPVLYVATATASDNEMAERIAHHQRNRPLHWQLQEHPLELIAALEREAQLPQTILVDCLTLWLNNQLFHHPEQDFSQLASALAGVASRATADIIFVANEVGLGIIPLGNLSRQFVDEAGRLNQALAKVADQVFFIAAGLPLTLKAIASD
ncbi:MAG TPA: bifunctional adenosylcobinamide kinase/adenosylcobinamide-phosphate guanylyltransferase [Cellvibrio sp.]|nr:bifunctional adenosylcobinamide kinase/adenosylcobinamide-phosphate guanylyltransferase [Cellvibrio sp.]